MAGIRTHKLCVPNQALYQLDHSALPSQVRIMAMKFFSTCSAGPTTSDKDRKTQSNENQLDKNGGVIVGPVASPTTTTAAPFLNPI